MQITKTMYFTTLAITLIETLIEIENYAKIDTIFKEVIKNTWVYRQHISTHRFFYLKKKITKYL